MKGNPTLVWKRQSEEDRLKCTRRANLLAANKEVLRIEIPRWENDSEWYFLLAEEYEKYQETQEHID